MILDQYGNPTKPKRKVDRDTLGANPGYKQVAGDGKGYAVYEEYDPVMGIKRVLTRHADGTWSQQVLQNVQAFVDMNKVYIGDHKPHSKAPMQRQTSIPSTIYWDMLAKKCGWKPGKHAGEYDKTAFDKWINDSDNRAFKTVPGKISSKYNSWI